MMLKTLINIARGELLLEKDKEFEVDCVIQDCYRIKYPRKQKDKFYFVLVEDNEGELVD